MNKKILKETTFSFRLFKFVPVNDYGILYTLKQRLVETPALVVFGVAIGHEVQEIPEVFQGQGSLVL